MPPGVQGVRRASRKGRRRDGRSHVRPAGGAAQGGLVAAPAQLVISAPRPGALSVILLTGAVSAARWPTSLCMAP
ncbi:hypothetical protein HispidOSU_022477 [Sigmodon hispidus]